MRPLPSTTQASSGRRHPYPTTLMTPRAMMTVAFSARDSGLFSLNQEKVQGTRTAAALKGVGVGVGPVGGPK